MAYVKTTWVDNETPITAENLNHIESGIESTEMEIPSIETASSTSETDAYSCKYINDLISNMNNKVLWGDDYSYMTGSQKATLSDKVSNQPHGIVIIWSVYSNGQPQDWGWNTVFVPKQFVSLRPSAGVVCKLCSSTFSNVGTKYVYVADEYIAGNDANTQSGTANGISYNNSNFVLRYVIGV